MTRITEPVHPRLTCRSPGSALTRVELTAMSERKRIAFTLVELLVVVAIIVTLIAILLPSLGRAIEVSNRAVCGARQRQVSAIALTYAASNRRQFMSTNYQQDLWGGSEPNHISWLSGWAIHEFVPNFDRDAPDESADVIGLIDSSEELLYCPNREQNWRLDRRQTWGVRVGFYFQFGHYGRPDYVGPTTWTSTLNVGHPTRGARTPMTTDIIEHGTIVPPLTSASHGSSHVIYNTSGAAPDTLPIAGSNIGRIDGSVEWRAFDDMEDHKIIQAVEYRRGWW